MSVVAVFPYAIQNVCEFYKFHKLCMGVVSFARARAVESGDLYLFRFSSAVPNLKSNS